LPPGVGLRDVDPPEPPDNEDEFGCRHSWWRTGELDGTNYYTCRKCGATCEV
jgi:hypothetical protein